MTIIGFSGGLGIGNTNDHGIPLRDVVGVVFCKSSMLLEKSSEARVG